MSLLIPSDIRISKATNLYGPRDSVFSLIKNEKNWVLWHPMYKNVSDRAQWLLINKNIAANTDSTFIVTLQQPGRPPLTSGWQLYHYQSTDSITLQWYLDFKLSWYPWEKFSSLFYEKTYGKMMEDGLANLKQLNLNHQPFK